jgi:hypothetical protein
MHNMLRVLLQEQVLGGRDSSLTLICHVPWQIGKHCHVSSCEGRHRIQAFLVQRAAAVVEVQEGTRRKEVVELEELVLVRTCLRPSPRRLRCLRMYGLLLELLRLVAVRLGRGVEVLELVRVRVKEVEEQVGPCGRRWMTSHLQHRHRHQLHLLLSNGSQGLSLEQL